MVCLDTSVLIPLIRKEKAAIEKLRTESESGNHVSTTIISLCELYLGAYGSKDPTREVEKVESVISTLRILDLSQEAGRKYGELAHSQSLKRSPIGDFDLLIACIASESGEALATRNAQHFAQVPGLKLESW